MDRIFTLYNKYKKYICTGLTVLSFLLMVFPLQNCTDIGKAPYFLKTISYFIFAYKYAPKPWLDAIYTFLFYNIVALTLFVLFILISIWFLIRLFKNKKAPFIVPFIIAFVSFSFLQIQGGESFFRFSATYITFCVIFIIYLIGFFLYIIHKHKDRIFSTTIRKVVDKVKSHKSKSERIEELERQNAEMKKRLDDLESKDRPNNSL